MNGNLKVFRVLATNGFTRSKTTTKSITQQKSNNQSKLISSTTTTQLTTTTSLFNGVQQLAFISNSLKNQLDLGLLFSNKTKMAFVNNSIEFNQSRQKTEYAKRPKRVANSSGPELLQYIAKVQCRFWPSHPRSGSVRNVISTFTTDSAKATNERCVVEHKVVEDGSDPYVKVEFENGKVIEISSPTLKFNEIMDRIKSVQQSIDLQNLINDMKIPEAEDLWTPQPKKQKKDAKKKEEPAAAKPAAGGKPAAGKPAAKK